MSSRLSRRRPCDLTGACNDHRLHARCLENKVAALSARKAVLMIGKFLRLLFAIGVCFIFLSDRGAEGLAGSVRPMDNSRSFPEYLMKAAYLYEFALSTDWPERAFADPIAPLRVCVLGKDPFGPTLATIVGRKVGDRQVVTSYYANVEGVERCHVLFISRSKKKRLAKILEHLQNRPVLVVADTPNFMPAGGIINFRIVEKQIRFEINATAAERAGLRLSSELLRMAEPYTAGSGQTQVDGHVQ